MRVKIIALLFVIAFALSGADKINRHPEQDSVYICNSTGATKYHLTSNCRGLNACDSKIIKVTKSEAVSKGKKELCGRED